MINNLEQIRALLQFDSGDDFYFLQIIKRRKENPEMDVNSVAIKTYYVTSLEHLDAIMPEMVSLCDFHNARGCINLNVRSFERATYQTLKKVTDIVISRDYKAIRGAFDSVCGEMGAKRDKRWVVDIDSFDEEFDREIRENINKCEPFGEKILGDVPTKNGHHLICSPFDLRGFHIEGCDIHKNNPTVLYMP